ncbi:hypothetical protein [Micromonospora sp. ALFpr18c]|uniref:MmyB family transcriptional regulator n=1 Tax=Micromonospora sp. ALFpr18c TaxID=1458665 RepID=UPI00351AA1D4
MGDLDLYCDKLAVAGADGQLLVIYHAEPGSESARSLALLGSIAASSPDDSPVGLHAGVAVDKDHAALGGARWCCASRPDRA